MTSTPIIDIHVHSTLKPYGNSFYSNSNKRSITDSACVWFKDKFTLLDRRDEITLGVSRYRQSDFTTLAEGQHRIVCVSIYPIEKEFTDIQSSVLKVVENTLIHFASLFGKNRITIVPAKKRMVKNSFFMIFEFKDLQLIQSYILGIQNFYRISAEVCNFMAPSLPTERQSELRHCEERAPSHLARLSRFDSACLAMKSILGRMR